MFACSEEFVFRHAGRENFKRVFLEIRVFAISTLRHYNMSASFQHTEIGLVSWKREFYCCATWCAQLHTDQVGPFD